ncbi:unnamed protein product [Pleuronectes platessa]|uniref:Uncharacterized protein n=1 Tax=Pleuronectes platessa TaxID=8262 RepID=A0A9N7UP42_PLEPL|nr:unnamed protein product [Pleuronectes platessa]
MGNQGKMSRQGSGWKSRPLKQIRPGVSDTCGMLKKWHRQILNSDITGMRGRLIEKTGYAREGKSTLVAQGQRDSAELRKNGVQYQNTAQQPNLKCRYIMGQTRGGPSNFQASSTRERIHRRALPADCPETETRTGRTCVNRRSQRMKHTEGVVWNSPSGSENPMDGGMVCELEAQSDGEQGGEGMEG